MTIPPQHPTERSTQQVAAMSPEQKRLLLQRLLEQQAAAAKCFGMSIGQQGLWFAYRRDPTSTAFNVFLPTRIVSHLNLDALRRAIHFLVERHPCLRTTFSDRRAELRQTVHASLLPEFEVLDATGLDDEEVRKQVLAHTQRPFDLEAGPLLRLAVFVRGSQDHIVVATTHHIVVDFWSLVLVLAELREIYRSFAADATPSLPPPTGNYATFVAEQQAMLAGPQAELAWQHWMHTLEGAPLVLNWFTDFERPAAFTGKANVVSIPFSASVTAAVKRIATEQSTTQAAVVLAALQVFIARYTGENDFLIGSPFSGRGHSKYESTVGFFVNLLPLRARLADNPTFAMLVRRASKSLVKSLEYEYFPLAEIIRRIQPPRDASRSPLFQVSCTFEKSHRREQAGLAGFLMPTEIASADVGGIRQQSFYIPHPTCHHDIEFIFEQTESSWQGMICYCRDLFDDATAQCMAENFLDLIENLTLAPNSQVSDISWSLPRRTSGIDRSHHSTETLTRQLEVAFRLHAHATALIDGETSLTYNQLDRDSRNLAQSLHACGVGRGDIVPVIGSRGLATTIALIGVIRAGAAVVPIDADQPTICWKDLLEDTAAKWIVVDQANTREHLIASLALEVDILTVDDLVQTSTISQQEASFVPRGIKSEDLAYVIYTSGSTGRPKGVMINHGAIANTIRWRCDHVSLSERDRVLMLLSHQFDAGFGIELSTLAQGGALVWPASHRNFDLEQSIETIQQQQITIVPAVPSQLQLFATHRRFCECTTLRQIWSGGEQMPSDLPRRIWEQLRVRLWNFYGPTEASVETTAYEVSWQDIDDHQARRVIPIGKPIANTDVVVLDDRLQVVPETVPGQLAIMGRGLARGYLNRNEQTAASFVPAIDDASGSSRMYLTGDLGRRRSAGCLEWLGRIDQQIKLHGYRIELEEIENVLRMHPSVVNAAVTVVQRDTPGAQLVAYVVASTVQIVAAESRKQCIDAIGRHITAHLPKHKRPTQTHFVTELPLGSNGKVNRDALVRCHIVASRLISAAPRTSSSPPDSSVDNAPINSESYALSETGQKQPCKPLEEHIARLWCELLQISPVGVHQNFFELGGSSLQAAMMTARLSDELGVHVPTALVFDLADIASIAERLATLHPQQIGDRFSDDSRSATFASECDRPSITSESRFAHSLIAPLSTAGDREPIFMVHPPGGLVICYRELAMQTPGDRPFLAIRSRGLHGQEPLPKTIEAMAADYVDAMRSVQPVGPYVVGGWSLGGVIAYEVAKRLLDLGNSVTKLILLDSTIPPGASDLMDVDEASQVGREYGIDMTLRQLSELDADAQLPFLWQHAVNLGVLKETSQRDVVQRVLGDLKHLFRHHAQLASDYRMQPLDISVLLVRPQDTPVIVKTSLDRGWGRLVKDVQVKFVPGHHHSMVVEPHVAELAKVIADALR